MFLSTGTFKLIFFLIASTIIGSIATSIYSDLKTEVVENQKVIRLQQQNILIDRDNSSTQTKVRYLVITERETFICESSVLNGKFNNSDLFFHLKENQTYTFKVCGYGKGFITDYRNILEVIPPKE